ncbi:MAG: HAD-IC family P-type ATPase, partial [Chloroflexota bacterium]
MAITRQTYRVSGMDCAGCAQTLQNSISRIDGVNAARVDFLAGKLVVDGDVTIKDLQTRAEQAGGYTVHADTSPSIIHRPLPTGPIGFVRYILSDEAAQYGLVGGLVTLLTLMAGALGLPPNAVTVGTISGVLIAAYPIAHSGIKTLITQHRLNLYMLMTIAALGAIIIGETVEAAAVVILYAMGEAIEGYAADRARDSIRSLADLAPPTAHKLNGDSTYTIPVAELVVGDMIRVKPGERIPMDGEITSGRSSINEAPITGESMPVNKTVGASVYAGTVNGEGVVTLRVTALAEDNTISRVIKLVEDAQDAKSP